MSSSSIWLIERTLSGGATPSQTGTGSDGNKEVFRMLQRNSITGASPSNFLVSYPGLLLEVSYSSAGIQSVGSAAPADWATWPSLGLSYYPAEMQSVYSADWATGHSLEELLFRNVIDVFYPPPANWATGHSLG